MHPSDGKISNGNDGSSPEQWMIEVKDRMLAPPLIPHANQQPSIFFAPEIIRSLDPPAYTPQLVSIGPYHHTNTLPENEITASLRDYKRHCARILLCPEGTQDYSLIYKCLDNMKKKLVPDIRSCYSTGLTSLTDHEIAEMMLYDGSFIIRCLLERHVTQQRPLLGMLWIWNVIKYDMLKLENQIPFFVLEELFKFINNHEVSDVPGATAEDPLRLVNLVLDLFRDVRPLKSKSFEAKGNVKYLHLLHIFHSSLLPHDQNDNMVGFNRDRSLHNPASHDWIPSATELQRAGVVFKENKSGRSFLDVRFAHGVLKIPSLRITDYSGTIFRNLIAFEQCSPDTRFHITAYAVFMDCLIDTARDVSLLDSKGILVNRLSTDEAVANLFNSLTYQVHHALDKNYPRDLFAAVNKYQQSQWHQDRAVLIRDYFSSPWSVISVIAATLLLLLTAVVTFYTVYPYYHPHK